MALVCKNGAKECCGCGCCDRFGESNEVLECQRCGEELASGEGYGDAMYATLCLECLKLLYRL